MKRLSIFICALTLALVAANAAPAQTLQPGSARADAQPIHAPAPIGEAVSQFLYWARNMREAGQQNHECSDNLRHRGARFICDSPYRTLMHELPLTEEKPKTECANCSMKSPENLRSTRRRRCGAPRAGRAANVFTPMRASSKPGMALPLPSMTSRSAHRQGVLWLRRPGRSPTP